MSFIMKKQACLLLLCLLTTSIIIADPIIVNTSPTGEQGNGFSILSSGFQGNVLTNLSANGRFLVYESNASNLVDGTNNVDQNIFLYDWETNTNQLINLASNGSRVRISNGTPSISADGRFIVFRSSETTLSATGRTEHQNISLYDRQTDQVTPITTEIDTLNSPPFAPVISANGNFITYHDGRFGALQLYDRLNKTVLPIPARLGGSMSADGRFISHTKAEDETSAIGFFDTLTNINTTLTPSEEIRFSAVKSGISASGRYLVFNQHDSNSVADDANGKLDTFVYDTLNQQTTLVSKPGNGVQANGDSFLVGILADEKRVAFVSTAENLVAGDINNQADLFFYNIETQGITRFELLMPISQLTLAAISADGAYFAYSSGSNHAIVLQAVDELESSETPADFVSFFHESPARQSHESGLGLIRGWICQATEIQYSIDDQEKTTILSGLDRADTKTLCGDSNNGYATLINYNLIGDGEHTIKLYANNQLFAEERFIVTSFGAEFLTGAARSLVIPDFPVTGTPTQLSWSTAHQNFVLTPFFNTSFIKADGISVQTISQPFQNPATPSKGFHESPGDFSAESGLGLIRGWACQAGKIIMKIDDAPWVEIPYGISREDTQSICGDRNNGYAFLKNWNVLGPGQHRIQVRADNTLLADTMFVVTTLGEEFVTGLKRTVSFNHFPFQDDRLSLEWSEAHQNFVVTEYTAGIR
jgi:Tol biopolymer transport system component